MWGFEFSNNRIVQKIHVTMPEKFEATITSLESTKGLSKITLAELLNALQAQEQRRLMRHEKIVEDALQAKLHISSAAKGKNYAGNSDATTNNNGSNATNDNTK